MQTSHLLTQQAPNPWAHADSEIPPAVLHAFLKSSKKLIKHTIQGNKYFTFQKLTYYSIHLWPHLNYPCHTDLPGFEQMPKMETLHKKNAKITQKIFNFHKIFYYLHFPSRLSSFAKHKGNSITTIWRKCILNLYTGQRSVSQLMNPNPYAYDSYLINFMWTQFIFKIFMHGIRTWLIYVDTIHFVRNNLPSPLFSLITILFMQTNLQAWLPFIAHSFYSQYKKKKWWIDSIFACLLNFLFNIANICIIFGISDSERINFGIRVTGMHHFKCTQFHIANTTQFIHVLNTFYSILQTFGSNLEATLSELQIRNTSIPECWMIEMHHFENTSILECLTIEMKHFGTTSISECLTIGMHHFRNI